MQNDDATPTRRAGRTNGAGKTPATPKRTSAATATRSRETKQTVRGANGNTAAMAEDLAETQRRLAAAETALAEERRNLALAEEALERERRRADAATATIEAAQQRGSSASSAPPIPEPGRSSRKEAGAGERTERGAGANAGASIFPWPTLPGMPQ